MRTFSRRLIKLLTQEHIPVWMTLCLFVLGTLVTYWVAPKINAQFEMQAARREFLVKSLQSFADETKRVVDIASEAISQKEQATYLQWLSEESPSIAKLQFSAAQLIYVIPEYGDKIVSFQKELDSLQDSLISFQAGRDPTPIIERAKSLTVDSLDIYDALLREAGLGGVSTQSRLEHMPE